MALLATRHPIQRLDHLGSNRAVVDEFGKVLQAVQYYPSGLPMAYADIAEQPYLFNGKEYDRMHALDLYDYGFRSYDPALMSWTSVDPLSSKYPQLSPYAYCLNNPIRYPDPQGLKPTEEEAALMAAYVYRDILIKLKGGWQEVEYSPFSVTRSNGLQSMLFQREGENGKTEYTLAFAGTQITDKQDWLNDFTQIYGFSSQYNDAIELAKGFISQKDDEITYVGHSLGGGLSAACAYATGGQAMTFNAAGVSLFTQMPNPNAQIDAYVTIGDPLNTIQWGSLVIPNVDGKVHLRLPNQFGILGAHSISNFYGTSLWDKAKNAWKGLNVMYNLFNRKK